MGKLIFAGLLAFSGLSILSDYPVVGFGTMAVAGLLIWMSLQGRRAAHPISHARPTEWARARQESAMQVARAEREARAVVRRAVRQADRRGQVAVQRASERVGQEQGAGWSA
ncbi:Uncharacterised protein [Mycobacteroides abscessus subsp. abscessus]|uniref:hypothetical protein n=1 Tax=Mycobacteroides abscessus TaxID=36809 RepID=UPI0005E99234|nr:hypothetical protein [Mycobacteroides abscessus]ANO18559.1 hypothetical protein BAB78_08270 [Mycobacteroides abscessus]MDB2220704.1 hypothetical protein [Mycobacteroides abscessus subsp. abscessus]OTR03287.1 hypothetical protein B9M85_08505 [Mycobacteroides abscessus]CPR84255.1 Uncharacterised protein [Mycobacteroides abscessus]SHT05041.1 Uncharacterised protein [Mycobacteroides abscessus subsp. abscessus]